ncbi:type II toxin-antitoxin system RelE/ParE family toxin [Proteiniphilum sp.]|uniref:type II toxin-antitoxin system RelE family toxin n=1 Tax=Proteiniphilum sp. TaxID=1926877 RepID=UPI002B1EE9FA|nr:type II toxin-antitoxin system RelE/ParE family toxin [Proteiniphilum sp.]MEA4918979.1 type II toxin-antitoxin system RelE/ParE family toxin [Proteiniphilum sp.]
MYAIEFTHNALKSLQKIDPVYQYLIIEKLEVLQQNPYGSSNVKALKGMSGYYRLRVANYRVIYELQDENLVILVIDINHRKDVYR